MTVTISQYIETLHKSTGRFRTLEGLYPVLDEQGEPQMQVGERCVDFEVVWRGEYYTLRCLLGANAKVGERLKDAALFTQLIETPYLLSLKYLEDEITVFDTSGTAQVRDVLLLPKPEGVRLSELMDEAAANNSGTAIQALGTGLAAMAKWLWNKDFSSGGVSSRTIFVYRGGTPVISDYTHAQRRRSLLDIRALAALEAAIYCAACEPRLISPMLAGGLTGRSKLIDLAAELCERLCDEETGTLTALLSLIGSEQSNYDEYAVYLLELATALAAEKPARIASLIDLADALCGESGFATIEPENPLGKYLCLGEMSCNLMRAFDGKRWCYVDKTGRAVIAGDFIDAADFEEGRAVVETPAGFGMIDTEGRFVIAPEYDDLDWDSYNNLVIATQAGLSGLFSRMGEQLTGLIYEQIMNCSEGLIPARRDGLYGYLAKDGSVAIDFVFGDAFGFTDGTARVRRSGHELIIDRNGIEIDRIIK
jgi:hypothetical protein